MDSLLFLEFLRHFNKKPCTIRPRIRKDLFDHFDDEEFKKWFRLTKSTVTKLLEQVYQQTAQRLKASYFYRYFYILHYYNISVPSSVRLQPVLLTTSPTTP